MSQWRLARRLFFSRWRGEHIFEGWYSYFGSCGARLEARGEFGNFCPFWFSRFAGRERARDANQRGPIPESSGSGARGDSRGKPESFQFRTLCLTGRAPAHEANLHFQSFSYSLPHEVRQGLAGRDRGPQILVLLSRGANTCPRGETDTPHFWGLCLAGRISARGVSQRWKMSPCCIVHLYPKCFLMQLFQTKGPYMQTFFLWLF